MNPTQQPSPPTPTDAPRTRPRRRAALIASILVGLAAAVLPALPAQAATPIMVPGATITNQHLYDVPGQSTRLSYSAPEEYTAVGIRVENKWGQEITGVANTVVPAGNGTGTVSFTATAAMDRGYVRVLLRKSGDSTVYSTYLGYLIVKPVTGLTTNALPGIPAPDGVQTLTIDPAVADAKALRWIFAGATGFSSATVDHVAGGYRSLQFGSVTFSADGRTATFRPTREVWPDGESYQFTSWAGTVSAQVVGTAYSATTQTVAVKGFRPGILSVQQNDDGTRSASADTSRLEAYVGAWVVRNPYGKVTRIDRGGTYQELGEVLPGSLVWADLDLHRSDRWELSNAVTVR